MDNRENALSNKIAVITGAARGIGAATAKLFAGQGAKVVIADVDLAPASELAAELRARSQSAVAVRADVASADSVVSLVKTALAEYGGIDILVNNAGIGTQKPFLETPLDLWRHIIDVNLTGAFLCAQEASRVMKDSGGGSIVNVASTSGQRASTNRIAYGTSKAAVIMLTRQMAIELASFGIRVNAVAPGPTDTEQSRSAHSPAQRNAYLRQLPLKRYASPDEIAKVIMFLAGDDASFMTGEIVNVDGGFVAGGILTED